MHNRLNKSYLIQYNIQKQAVPRSAAKAMIFVSISRRYSFYPLFTKTNSDFFSKICIRIALRFREACSCHIELRSIYDSARINQRKRHQTQIEPIWIMALVNHSLIDHGEMIGLVLCYARFQSFNLTHNKKKYILVYSANFTNKMGILVI